MRICALCVNLNVNDVIESMIEEEKPVICERAPTAEWLRFAMKCVELMGRCGERMKCYEIALSIPSVSATKNYERRWSMENWDHTTNAANVDKGIAYARSITWWQRASRQHLASIFLWLSFVSARCRSCEKWPPKRTIFRFPVPLELRLNITYVNGSADCGHYDNTSHITMAKRNSFPRHDDIRWKNCNCFFLRFVRIDSAVNIVNKWE